MKSGCTGRLCVAFYVIAQGSWSRNPHVKPLRRQVYSVGDDGVGNSGYQQMG